MAGARIQYDMVAALATVAPVTMVEVYRMMPVRDMPAAAQDAIADDNVLAVILMSARSAQLFRDQLASAGHDARRHCGDCRKPRHRRGGWRGLA